MADMVMSKYGSGKLAPDLLAIQSRVKSNGWLHSPTILYNTHWKHSVQTQTQISGIIVDARVRVLLLRLILSKAGSVYFYILAQHVYTKSQWIGILELHRFNARNISSFFLQNVYLHFAWQQCIESVQNRAWKMYIVKSQQS